MVVRPLPRGKAPRSMGLAVATLPAAMLHTELRVLEVEGALSGNITRFEHIGAGWLYMHG